MSLVADIKTKLTGITSDIYLNDMPDTPNNIISIYNTGGTNSLHALDTISAEQPSFQVRVRHTSNATALGWIDDIKDALDGLVDETINSTVYISIFLSSDVLNLGKDDRERCNYSINFITKIRRN